MIRRLVVVERQTLHHRVASEFRAQPVDRVFGVGGAPVDQVGEVVTYGVFQVADADADEAETLLVSRSGFTERPSMPRASRQSRRPSSP